MNRLKTYFEGWFFFFLVMHAVFKNELCFWKNDGNNIMYEKLNMEELSIPKNTFCNFFIVLKNYFSNMRMKHVKHENGLRLFNKSKLWLYSDQVRYSVFWPGQTVFWPGQIKRYLSSPLITHYIIIALIVNKLIVLVEEEDFKDDFQISYTSNWVDGCTIFLQRKDHPFPGLSLISKL